LQATQTRASLLFPYLANVALSHRLAPCVIDGDIGQGDLGPPATIGAAELSGPVTDMRDASATNQASKSTFERKSRRLDQFLRHVGGGSSALALRHIKFLYADGLFSPSVLKQPKIKQLDHENLKRMFVGLGSGSRVKGFGIVTGVTTNIIRIQTDVDYFDKVYLSNIRLDKVRPMDIRL
jgi:polynucleotide 5'-kinase involved in rRNA processing